MNLMPRPKQYDSDAERAHAWRERRGEELRTELARRLRDADDDTLDRLTQMIPVPALMRLSRALDWAEHPERAPDGGERRHGHRRHEHPHHHGGHGPMGRRRRGGHESHDHACSWGTERGPGA